MVPLRLIILSGIASKKNEGERSVFEESVFIIKSRSLLIGWLLFIFNQHRNKAFLAHLRDDTIMSSEPILPLFY